EREWLELRVRAVLSDPQVGGTARKILALLLEVPSISIGELSSKLNIEEQEAKRCIYVLQVLKLVEVDKEGIRMSVKRARSIHQEAA
ncbi:MAG: hypothetical protein ACP5KA_07235, partial [Desulfurococcaceae archaeon]